MRGGDLNPRHALLVTNRVGAAAKTTILVAATWDTRSPDPINVYAKNNRDGRWYETSLATVDNGNAQVRAFGVHVDAVTQEDLAFAGTTPTGIHHGFLSDKQGPGNNPIEWATGAENAEFKSADYTGPACTTPKDVDLSDLNRVTSFAEAGGKIYAAICFQVMERVDGPQGICGPNQVFMGRGCEPRWRVVYTDRDVGPSKDGLRGLTAITDHDKPALLAAEEGADGRIIRIDPETGVGEPELDIQNSLQNNWNLNTTYVIVAYNDMPTWFPAKGFRKQLIGVEAFLNPRVDQTPKPNRPFVLVHGTDILEGDAYYVIRSTANSYELVHIPRLTETGMVSVRAIAVSPFKDDCNPEGKECAIFFGGFDANKSETQTLCVEAPCTFPPLVEFPTHNTGWIVKGSGFAPGS
jgi:hypothetical protein